MGIIFVIDYAATQQPLRAVPYEVTLISSTRRAASLPELAVDQAHALQVGGRVHAGGRGVDARWTTMAWSMRSAAAPATRTVPARPGAASESGAGMTRGRRTGRYGAGRAGRRPARVRRRPAHRAPRESARARNRGAIRRGADQLDHVRIEQGLGVGQRAGAGGDVGVGAGLQLRGDGVDQFRLDQRLVAPHADHDGVVRQAQLRHGLGQAVGAGGRRASSARARHGLGRLQHAGVVGGDADLRRARARAVRPCAPPWACRRCQPGVCRAGGWRRSAPGSGR